MQPYRVVTARDHGMLVFRIHGELDLATVGACRANLDHLLGRAVRDCSGEYESRLSDAPSWTLVLLDLRELTFLSAAGLRMLGEIAGMLTEQGIATTIAAEPGSLTRRVLYLAGLDRRAIVIDALDEHPLIPSPAAAPPPG
jgi:anti-anti-sigma regulatory factor